MCVTVFVSLSSSVSIFITIPHRKVSLTFTGNKLQSVDIFYLFLYHFDIILGDSATLNVCNNECELNSVAMAKVHYEIR